MPPKKVQLQRKGKGPSAHKLPEEFPKDIILKDTNKAEWRLGEKIGQGGFGLIYFAADKSEETVTGDVATHVIKVEPVGNGPLFCEMHFYLRAAKADNIESFRRAKKLQFLGVPPHVGSGRHEYNTKEYRFLVMPRFGEDLQAIIQKSGGKLDPAVTLVVALRMIDALQYIHEQGYVHADIKASNILTGYSSNPNEVYLADYGLATKYITDDKHREYKLDPRTAHNGTVEYTSIDAHQGVSPSRRGDLEILGYCIIHWISGHLPWEDLINDANSVKDSKIRHMNDVKSFIQSSLGKSNAQLSVGIADYLQNVNGLEYNEEPDYAKLKGFMKKALTALGVKDEWRIELRQTQTGRKASKRKSTDLKSPDVKKPKKEKNLEESPRKAQPNSRAKAELTNGHGSPKKSKKATPSPKAKTPLKGRTTAAKKSSPSPKAKTAGRSRTKAAKKSSPSLKAKTTGRGRTTTAKGSLKKISSPKCPPATKSLTKQGTPSGSKTKAPLRSPSFYRRPPPTKK